MLRPLAVLTLALASALLASANSPNCGDHPHTQHPGTNHSTSSSSLLPVIFFHGAGLNASSGHNFEKNLTAEGRTFVALSFCEDDCTATSIRSQVALAITQVRGIVSNDSRFESGYIFMAHSLGGAISRGVVEDMDDHKVRKYVSLAGVQNGVFWGPQPDDVAPTELFVTTLGPSFIPTSLMNFSSYSAQDLKGKMQTDLAVNVTSRADLQNTLSAVNLPRFPVHDQWLNTSAFFPLYNNMNDCAKAGNTGAEAQSKCRADQQRRKRNFLKLEVAHFLMSPSDGFIAPWQSSILGMYSEVATIAQVETKFEELKVLAVNETREYQSDSYGLRTLDQRGGLQRHVAQNVPHECWTVSTEATSATANDGCDFAQVYDQHIYPLLT
ncbi:Lysosomal thioesterase ppt2 [Globisporangium polare]